MKKLVLAAVSVAMISFTSCSKDDENGNGNGSTPNLSQTLPGDWSATSLEADLEVAVLGTTADIEIRGKQYSGDVIFNEDNMKATFDLEFDMDVTVKLGGQGEDPDEYTDVPMTGHMSYEIISQTRVRLYVNPEDDDAPLSINDGQFVVDELLLVVTNISNNSISFRADIEADLDLSDISAMFTEPVPSTGEFRMSLSRQ